MTIEQSCVVDFVGEDESGNIVLTISDHLEWNDEDNHCLLLQGKLNTYLSFIESGEIYQSYEKANGKAFIIDIAFKYPPNEFGQEFLSKAKDIINAAGIGVNWGVLDVG